MADLRSPRYIAREPIERQPLDLLQRPSLFEKMRGVVHDGQLRCRANVPHRCLIELDNRLIIAANDHRYRRLKRDA